MRFDKAVRRFCQAGCVGGLLLPSYCLGVEYTYNFTYNTTAYSNKVWIDDSLASGAVRGTIVAFDYGGAGAIYTSQAWRNFATDRKLAITLMMNQDNLGIPASTSDGLSILNSTLGAAAGGTGHSELGATTLPLIFAGISRGGTSGAIAHGWAAGANRTVAAIAYHGNSFNYLPSPSSAAGAIPVLYPMAQLDSLPSRQGDIETAVRTNSVVPGIGAAYGYRPTSGLFWTTTMQYGSSHASLGDDTYPLQWLGRAWDARFNPATPGTLSAITAAGSVDGVYTLSNPNSSTAYFSSLSTTTFKQKDGNIWLPSAGASEWLAESAQPTTGTAYNIDSTYNSIYTAPDKILARNFINAGSIIFSGTGVIGLDDSGGGNPVRFLMTGGSLIIRNGCTLRNGANQGGIWTSNKASLDIGAGSTLDLYDGNPVIVDALSGAGLITTGTSAGGTQNITAGINNSSGTFTGSIQNGTKSVSFTKAGTGTQTLSGASTYTGPTVVTGGTLSLAGTYAPSVGSTTTLSVSSGATVRVESAGSATFYSVSSPGSSITINGSLNIVGAGASSVASFNGSGSLNISNGLVTAATGTGTADVIRAISISAGGKLDLTNNLLIVRTTGARNGIRALITSGQNGVDANGLGNWTGSGMVSSTARSLNVSRSLNLYTVAVIRNGDLNDFMGTGNSYSTFGGQNVGTEDVLVRFTYNGDTDLNGSITFSDYVNIDSTYGGTRAINGWVSGDFNNDGSIGIEDYVAIDTAYAFQSGALSQTLLNQRLTQFGPQYVSQLERIVASLSAVPEPAATGVLVLSAMLLGRRRQRP